MAKEIPLVLLDEPTSALDLGRVVDVLELVRESTTGGRAVVMVLHDPSAAARYADTAVAMKGGRGLARESRPRPPTALS